MNVEIDTQIYECQMATLWLSDDGILNFVSKPEERSYENAVELISVLRMMSKGNKMCVLVDTTHSKPMNREVRDYLVKHTSLYYKAVAVTSKSSLGAFVANIFLRLNPPAYPIRIFSDESSAKSWLATQL